MSFEVFLQTFKGGDNATFERAIAERLFAPYVHEVLSEQWDVRLPDGSPSLGQIFVDQEPLIDSLHVLRPPGDIGFWDAMYQLMKETGALLYWPGEPLCAVTDAAVLEELPAGFVEEVVERDGPIPIVTSGQELWDVIRTS
jgi:hypothetical protein